MSWQWMVSSSVMRNTSSILHHQEHFTRSIYRLLDPTAHPPEGMGEFNLTGMAKGNKETCYTMFWSDFPEFEVPQTEAHTEPLLLYPGWVMFQLSHLDFVLRLGPFCLFCFLPIFFSLREWRRLYVPPSTWRIPMNEFQTGNPSSPSNCQGWHSISPKGHYLAS